LTLEEKSPVAALAALALVVTSQLLFSYRMVHKEATEDYAFDIVEEKNSFGVAITCTVDLCFRRACPAEGKGSPAQEYIAYPHCPRVAYFSQTALI
jgi:hypothetical protein